MMSVQHAVERSESGRIGFEKAVNCEMGNLAQKRTKAFL